MDRLCFNPRAHAGRDVADRDPPLGPIQFQSTRPRGARPTLTDPFAFGWVFQSTRPRGARLRLGKRIAARRAFQSTRPRGARRIDGRVHPVGGRFQSTRPRGARRYRRPIRRPGPTVSIHAPTRGATLLAGEEGAEVKCFNPRAHAGRDYPQGRRRRLRGCFNPRAHAGRDSAAPR